MQSCSAFTLSCSSSNIYGACRCAYEPSNRDGFKEGTAKTIRRSRRNILWPSFILLLTSTSTNSQEQATQPPKNALIQKLLEKSNANREKYAKERLDDYYKRNYKDYFESVEGSLRRKGERMTQTEKGILEWLDKNR